MNAESITPEQELLGAILLEPVKSIFLARKAGVSPISFADARNKTAWLAIMRLQAKGKPVEIPTIMAELDDSTNKSEFGLYLEWLVDKVPTATSAGYYVHEVKRIERKREAVLIMRETLEKLQDQKESDEKISACISELMQVNLRLDIPVHKYGDVREAKVAQWREAQQAGTVGMPFCIHSVNQWLGGWRPGCFSIIGAYRGLGKSTLARQDAYSHAMAGRGALLFSLEDPYDIAAASIAGCHAGKSTFHCDKGDAYTGTIDALDAAWQETADLPLWIVSSAVGITDIVAISEMFVMRHNIKIVYVDHIQYIAPQILKDHNRNTTIAQYSMTLAGMAKRLGIPVIAMSQLSRDGEKSDRAKPRLSDLRDSGSLEQDARQVLMLYEDKNQGCFFIDVAKNNYGISNKEVQVWRLDGKNRFSEIQPESKNNEQDR